MQKTIFQIAEQLLLAVKMQETSAALVEDLMQIELSMLHLELDNDERKKAFWINIYNAFFQILRKEKQLQKPEIFRGRHLEIAGQPFSLDDVEHGILRRFRYKYSLGYLANPFVSNLIKQLAVSKVDYRIHFALNCGAKSCPPIAFYNSDKIEQQLELATISFLEGETQVDQDKKEIHTTSLFQWYLGDFGGVAGVRTIIQETLNIDIKGFKIIYNPYSWEEQLDNYT